MMTKYLFVGGKGGVGKTSIASALALFYSQKGKTLLVSTDPVFALSDLWGTKLTNEPKEIAKNLFAKHINPDFYKGKTTSSPCASEKAALAEFCSHLIFSSDYDKIVFDTAPTGHTLLLLKLPQEWKEFIEKTPLGCGAEEGDEEKYEKIINILKSNQTLFNFVLIPEKLSIEETKRAVGELQKIGMKRFNFIVNMVTSPKIIRGNYFLKKRYEMQAKYIREIKSSFGCCYKIVFLQDSEIKGKNKLSLVANQIFTNCCF